MPSDENRSQARGQVWYHAWVALGFSKPNNWYPRSREKTMCVSMHIEVTFDSPVRKASPARRRRALSAGRICLNVRPPIFVELRHENDFRNPAEHRSCLPHNAGADRAEEFEFACCTCGTKPQRDRRKRRVAAGVRSPTGWLRLRENPDAPIKHLDASGCMESAVSRCQRHSIRRRGLGNPSAQGETRARVQGFGSICPDRAGL